MIRTAAAPLRRGRAVLTWLAVTQLLAVLMVTTAHAGLPHGLRVVEDAQPAPALDLVDLDGRRHRLSDYRGQVLVINFWATWCLPCREELPGMGRAARELAGDGVRVVTVAMGQDVTEVREFLAFLDFDLPKLVDPAGRAAEAWRVQTLPTSCVVDPAGRIALQVIGAYDWESPALWERLRALVR
jgi:thiol-disulfide isomerase/thioredoxin